MTPANTPRFFLALAALGLLGACGGELGASSEVSAVTAVCLERAAVAPAGTLFCDDARTLECASPRGAPAPTLSFRPWTGVCADWSVSTSSAATWLPLGANAIEIQATGRVLDGTATEVCRATVTVVDRVAPAVTPRGVSLWPPNHRFHHVLPSDCVTVTDACDPDVRVRFLWAASDEPANATGDGNTATDMQNFGCDGVDLLAERRGNGDGRVYTLGFRATDRSGNVTDGVCTVSVAHDQSGRVAVGGSEAQRINAPATCRD